MHALLSDPPERVAVFRALQLGDLLCAVPALRALRTAWPDARITLVGLPWAEAFVERFSHLVDDFMAFPGFPGLPEEEAHIAELPGFLAAAQARRFDLAIQMHGSGTLTNPLVTTFGARRTAGFTAPGGWCPDPAWYVPWHDAEPEVRRLLTLAERLGASPCGEQLEFPLARTERRAFAVLRRRLPIGDRGYVCIHPGARLPSRRWLPARFAAVADALAEAGYGIVLTGTPDEARLAEAVRDHMRTPAIDLVGRTTMGTFAALVGEAKLVVCNDTGMSHVAAAMATPSVVVACGSDPRRWAPLDARRHRVLWAPEPCRPCAYQHCPTGHECAVDLEAGEVIGVALGLLGIPGREVARGRTREAPGDAERPDTGRVVVPLKAVGAEAATSPVVAPAGRNTSLAGPAARAAAPMPVPATSAAGTATAAGPAAGTESAHVTG